MKVDIRDIDVLRSLKPVDLVNYLRTHGWSALDTTSTVATTWGLATDNTIEVLVPNLDTFSDYPRRVSDILRTASLVEQRSELDVYQDVRASSADLIRLRAIDPDYTNGTVPFEAGLLLVESTRDLLLAAACAATEPRSIFHTRKPTPAVEYMKHVRLGQTEIGSFVITVQSPVPPVLQASLSGMESVSEEPFQRRVTRFLVNALEGLRLAAQQSSVSGNIQPFKDAVPKGVSANLCDAIVKAYDASQAQSIAIGVSWAPVRPPLVETPRDPIIIPRDAVPILSEASRVFREWQPNVEARIEGFVVALKRDEGNLTGEVTIATVIDGSLRRVRVELWGSDYDLAIKAHKNEVPLRAHGELRRDGRMFHLKSAHDVSVVAGDPGDMPSEPA